MLKELFFQPQPSKGTETKKKFSFFLHYQDHILQVPNILSNHLNFVSIFQFYLPLLKNVNYLTVFVLGYKNVSNHTHLAQYQPHPPTKMSPKKTIGYSNIHPYAYWFFKVKCTCLKVITSTLHVHSLFQDS